jgi:hypothetical protein
MRFCVVYRTGGTENFVWKRTFPVGKAEEASEQCITIGKMGYRCFVSNYDKSMAIGLPDTYDFIHCKGTKY